MKRTLVFILLIYFAKISYAQPSGKSESELIYNAVSGNRNITETSFDRLSADQGLSNNNIKSINQDKDGFIWIATENGMNRYDGSKFKNFYNSVNDSFSVIYNKFDDIYKDNDHNLWMTTANGELIKYDRELDRFINFKLLENIYGKDWFTSVSEDNKGNLLLGCSTGLHAFNKKTGSITFMLGRKNLNGNMNPYGITFLMRSRNKNLWIGTAFFGLFILDTNNNIIKHYSQDSTDKSSLSNNIIRSIFNDSKNNIWVGTENGLNLFDEANDNFIVYKNDPGNPNSISHNNITSICEDKNNAIWIGTRKGGLNKLISPGVFISFKNDETDVNSLSHDHIDNLFVDKSNVLWIGTFGGGICKLDCQQKKFNLITKIFKNKTNNYQSSLGGIFFDSKGKCMITNRFSDGIFKFEKDYEEKLHFRGYEFVSNIMRESVVGDIVQVDQSRMLFATFFGELIEYNPVKKIVTKIIKKKMHRFNTLCSVDNFIYIGAENRGILKYDINKREFIDTDTALNFLSRQNIQSIYKDRENIIWICTGHSGLFRYEAENNGVTNFKFEESNEKSISDNFVNLVYEDRNGNIWAATANKGINKFIKTDFSFLRYGTETGLPENVNGILDDNNGYLWIRSFDGLYKFDPENATARRYDKSDGVQRYDFSNNVCNKDKDGILYFGGSKGLTYFNPDEIKDNPYLPEIVFTDFQIFNESVKSSGDNPFLKKSITAAEEVNLSYKESVFSIEFAALTFNNPGKNQYAYMMEGFDENWVYCGTRRNVTYTNLDPGAYTFKVKGSNNDGIWNEVGVSVKITISPPWWQTWWFKSCGAVLIFLTAGYGYKKRITKIRNEITVQEEFSRQLIASQEEERKRIASELHDTIAHDILLTKSKALFALRNPDDNDSLKNALNEISEMSSVTINDVREISYNLHPHQLERLGFSEAIESIVNDVSKASEINFKVDIDNVDDVITKEGEINLYRVIQEGISNILKHSKATEAELKVIRLEKQIIISISDNGIGFDSGKSSMEEKKHGFGLSGIAERVKILKGELKIEKDSSNWTVVRISIPISSNIK